MTADQRRFVDPRAQACGGGADGVEVDAGYGVCCDHGGIVNSRKTKRFGRFAPAAHLIFELLRSIVGGVIRDDVPGTFSGWRLGLCGDGLPAAWFSPV